MNGKTVHILVVEDEEAHAELIRRAFESQAERVCLTVACSLREARVSLAESIPDLVIADLLLPDGTGTELLPADQEASLYPVVIMTSHGDEQVAVEAMKTGAMDYVVKSETTLADMPYITERALREWGHITARKRAEEALRESEERFRKIFEEGPLGMAIVSLDHRLFKVNATLCQMLGYTEQELTARTFPDVTHPEDIEPEMHLVEQVFRGEIL